MNKKFDITEETYMGYGFKRQELTDFFHSKGKHVDFGVPPMSFEDSSDLDGALTLNDALAEVESLKSRVRDLEALLPILLGEYRNDDPLLLAIQIRNKDWLDYDPDNDRATRGNQAAIIHDLEKRGFPKRQAEAIELVACPIKRG
ncbi:hypothetical protein JQ098_004128 [Salmonella enterica subsp. enterica serovar Typhimurium]|uniref:Uncharacterized protein n=7 Tax=Salmonella enterica TaxID=28901 RepID=A0A752BGW3_SALEB|nr:hypothetical protein [Salmonella enterica]EBF8503130.1 hypothetical protein [Salmonella enterica subsp. enterica serovar Matopeni]EBG5398630.1 hypothetical protein [Salmonella enterica subsp. enterica serovar Newport]ECD2918059.1 hypothetical protein [Salmonella enterica subsp. enterica serovar Lexington]ECD3731759.1 hypothetical protein [Salmonella enterica subsp. enterica serovar Stanley]ECD5232274.1 hypothetical protein [Salmonella enterica subsp. enterica serovar Java]ECK2023119.1 hypo